MSNPVTVTRSDTCGLITIASTAGNALGQTVRSVLVEALEAAATPPFETTQARERERFLACLASPQRQAKVGAFLGRRKDHPSSAAWADGDDTRGTPA